MHHPMLPCVLLWHSISFLAARFLPAAGPTASRCLPGILLSAAFATSAYGLRGVTGRGAAAGALVSFILYMGAGRGGFLGLITVFLIAYVSSRIGYARKHELGVAESQRGRGAGQVLANLGVAAACSAMALVYSASPWLIAAVSALAEAAADTASSEWGEALSARAYLITSLRAAPVGTDGAISGIGSLAGLLAAVLVAGVCGAGRAIAPGAVVLAVAAAMIGTVADSCLGATLERRGIMGNNAVNLSGTTVAATAGYVMARLYR